MSGVGGYTLRLQETHALVAPSPPRLLDDAVRRSAPEEHTQPVVVSTSNTLSSQ
jgi:hypothetical protein